MINIQLQPREETFITSLMPYDNFNQYSQLIIGIWKEKGYKYAEALMYFSIDELLIDCNKIEKIYLNIRIEKIDKPTRMKIGVNLEEFNYLDVNWTTKPKYYTYNKDILLDKSDEGHYKKLDITDLGRMWCSKDIKNNGITLFSKDTDTVTKISGSNLKEASYIDIYYN